MLIVNKQLIRIVVGVYCKYLVVKEVGIEPSEKRRLKDCLNGYHTCAENTYEGIISI